MLSKGPAKKVTIFVNEDTQHHLQTLYEAVLSFLLHKGVSGATASRALAGFGSRRVLHSTKIEARAEHLPVRIEFIETAERVEELLPTLYDMVTDGMIEVQDTTVVKAASTYSKTGPTAHVSSTSAAKMIRVFLGEADKWNDEPLYEAIVKRLRLLDVAGATVYRGILGYGEKRHTHKQALFHRPDLPIMISIVESADKVPVITEALEQMVQDGLIVVSDVEMIRLVRARPDDEDVHAVRHTG